ANTFIAGLGWGFVGAVVGAGTVYTILRLGKWLFGRQRVKLPLGSRIVFGETAMYLPGKEIPYEDLFYRRSDVIVVKAKEVEMIDRSYFNAVVRLSPASLQIYQDRFEPEEFDTEDIPHMEVASTEVFLPREAMGLGDVKFMGAIGAFIGWQGVFFTLTVSSLIGAVYGAGMVALKKKEWSGRIYFGPFIALAAAIWIFAGRALMDWYQHFTLDLMTMLLRQ